MTSTESGARGEATGDELGSIIRRAKTELEQMIDMNPQIMLLVDPDRRVLRANRAVLNLLGKTSFGAVLGQPIDALFDCGDARFFPRLMARQDSVASGEAIVSLPNRNAHALRFSIVAGRDATAPGVVIVEDVTEEKQRDEDLRRAHRKEAIRELAGALMHTINQHLTVINVRARLLTMAVERGTATPGELKDGMADITDVTLKIADTLNRAGQPRDFGTINYITGTDILDLGDEREGRT
jgi:nitrogen-specific signal transduction histidine kinase